MQAIMYENKVFNDIFPDYETFKNWYLSTPFSEDETDVPTLKTFSLLQYEYGDSHIAFTEDGFKQHFAIDIFTFYKEFEETSKVIAELMKLTDEEIENYDISIVNIANVPEVESSTDVENVDFLSTQQKQISKKGKLQVKKEQLSNKRSYTTRSFIKKFKKLFIRILSPAYTFVIQEKEGE